MQVEDRARRAGIDLHFRMVRSALQIRLNAISKVEFRGEWEAGMLALFGIELRDPTADLDVVEFCLGIPPEQYLAEGIDRSLIRRAMWGILPAAVLANRKRGIQAPDRQTWLDRNTTNIQLELARLARNPFIREVIDFSTLRLPPSDPAKTNQYWRSQSIFDTALGTASFLDQLQEPVAPSFPAKEKPASDDGLP